MRLNAYLSRGGIASRRKADKMIKAGRVKVNGRPGRLNDDINYDDVVEVDSAAIKKQSYRYVLLNKPAGTLTTADDPQGRPTVIKLVKIKEKVAPVGRLDKDTTGALLLTNDGQLAYKLSHPKFGVTKVYQAEVTGSINQKILDLLSNGVELEDGMSAPAKAVKTSLDTLELAIHEGRKRQVRRMVKAVGLELRSLHRAAYGPLKLGSLRPGQWRELTQAEIKQLKGL